MGKNALTISFAVILIIIEMQAIFVSAAASMSQNIPPIVGASETQLSASILRINGELWAKVDAEYKMITIRAFGESYFDPVYGKTNVVTNKVEAHYPIPLSAKNISVKINNEEANWQIDNKGFCHIFDSNLPEINWTIQPVPHDFTVIIHYEQPIPSTNQSTAYLGQYALVFPLILRFGSTDTPHHPLYTWFDYETSFASFTIQTKPYINQINAYSMDFQGSLSKINYTNSIGGTLELQIPVNLKQALSQGVVLTMNAESAQDAFLDFPIIALISVVVVLACISLGLFVSRRKRKRSSKSL